MKRNVLRITNVVMLLAMVVVNFLANYLPIGYGNTSAISAQYKSLFTPAGYTFSIWGVIYVFMLLFVIWQWVDPVHLAVDEIGALFAVSCALNIAWIFVWHYRIIGASVIFIIGLLGSLVWIRRKLLAGRCSGFMCEAVKVGFDIYFGWVVAASIANISVFLVSISWNGFGMSEVFWTCVMLIAGTVIGLLPAFIEKRYVPTLAVMWAYAGILVKFLSDGEMRTKYMTITVVALICLAVMLFFVIIGFVMNRKKCAGIKRAEADMS